MNSTGLDSNLMVPCTARWASMTSVEGEACPNAPPALATRPGIGNTSQLLIRLTGFTERSSYCGYRYWSNIISVQIWIRIEDNGIWVSLIVQRIRIPVSLYYYFFWWKNVAKCFIHAHKSLWRRPYKSHMSQRINNKLDKGQVLILLNEIELFSCEDCHFGHISYNLQKFCYLGEDGTRALRWACSTFPETEGPAVHNTWMKD